MNPAASPDVLVNTEFGSLTGFQTDGLCVFKGVPYAEPPVGELRFKAPRPLKKWTGTRKAGPTAPASFQMNPAIAPKVGARIRDLDPGVKGILPWPSYVKSMKWFCASL